MCKRVSERKILIILVKIFLSEATHGYPEASKKVKFSVKISKIEIYKSYCLLFHYFLLRRVESEREREGG
jgi:hypothetical protein